MIEWEYCHFVIPSKGIDLGNDPLCLLMGVHSTPLLKYSCPTETNLNLIKPLDLIINLQEIQKTEKQIKWHHRNTMNKIQAILKTTWFLQQINCKEGRWGDLKEREVPTNSSIWILFGSWCGQTHYKQALWANEENLNTDWIVDDIKEL